MIHLAHGIRVKLVSNWKQSLLYTKSLQVLYRQGISMLTGLKVSSLTCKYVFYRPELMQRWNTIELNFASLEIKHQWIELKEYMRKMGSFV